MPENGHRKIAPVQNTRNDRRLKAIAEVAATIQ